MSDAIAKTPKPPYYAVIFTGVRAPADDGYQAMAEKMAALAAQQPGYLGHEAERGGLNMTVSYWSDLASIRRWKQDLQHLQAQRAGREKWYQAYRVRIAKVERDYGFDTAGNGAVT